MRTRKIAITVAFLSVAAAAIALVLAQEKAPRGDEPAEVLVVFASGNPADTGKDEGKADAITCPTPRDQNVGTIVQKIARDLREKKINVRILQAEEVADEMTLLDAGMLVLASPAYFSNMSWQMKKMIDERFGAVYRLKGRFNGKPVALFSMAAVEQSAVEALKAMETAVEHCNGSVKAKTFVLAGEEKSPINVVIADFVEAITDEVK